MKIKPDRPRGLVLSAESKNSFDFIRFEPHPDLAEIIEHYWLVNWDLEDGKTQMQSVVTHPSVHMTFENEKLDIYGIVRQTFVRKLEKRGSVLGVKFRPGMFFCLSGKPVHQLTGKVIPAEVLLGYDFKKISDDLSETALTDEKIKILEQKFLSLKFYDTEKARSINLLVKEIKENKNIVSAEQLSDISKTDIRQLERLFRKYIGIGPKWIINRYRMHEAMTQLENKKYLNLTELAVRLGYFDQSHFIRDFKKMTGVKPSDYGRK